jgi:NADH:ubiquinone oxidoreductase subunit 2 (subunit N)
MRARAVVAVVAGLAILGCAASLALGVPEGKRFGYQVLLKGSPGLSSLLMVVMLALTGVPLASFIFSDKLYMWNKWKMRFEAYDREEHPMMWWAMLWTSVGLFLALLGGLCVVRL